MAEYLKQDNKGLLFKLTDFSISIKKVRCINKGVVMKTLNFKKLSFALFAAMVMVAGTIVGAAELMIKDGDRVAIAGDSITEQKIYSCYIEAYLLACSGLKDVKTFNFGCGGEHAIRFTARMETDVWSWKPTVITTCYGMNDGYYRRYEEQLAGEPHRESMKKIVDFFKTKGVKVIVGTPGVVDIDTYKVRNDTDANGYNETLAKLAEFDQEIAQKENVGFANVNGVMMSAMLKAKAALGKNYHVAGVDGVHPEANGQLAMAYAFLKAMGFDGQVAEINMDLNGQTTVSDGHKILSQKPGMVEIESTRYPFCFTGADTDPSGNVSILPFVPFQQELNRFELKVSHLSTPKAEVMWGDQKKVFSTADLEKGINLAAEFISNPFSSPFNQLLGEIRNKQTFENWMIRNFFANFQTYMPEVDKDPQLKESLDYLRTKSSRYQADLDVKAKQNLKPVKYWITVNPVK